VTVTASSAPATVEALWDREAAEGMAAETTGHFLTGCYQHVLALVAALSNATGLTAVTMHP
jgi:hypothetical protein